MESLKENIALNPQLHDIDIGIPARRSKRPLP